MQVMIDLETLALTPDAAILQIGAVKFDNTGILGAAARRSPRAIVGRW